MKPGWKVKTILCSLSDYMYENQLDSQKNELGGSLFIQEKV